MNINKFLEKLGAEKPYLRQHIRPLLKQANYFSDPRDLIDFARSYANLGSAIQDQLDKLIDDGKDAKISENAVKKIKEKLGQYSDDITNACEEWLDNAKYGDDDE